MKLVLPNTGAKKQQESKMSLLVLLGFVCVLGCSVQAICEEKYGVVVCDRFTKQTRIANMEKITRLIVSGVEDFGLTQKDLPHLKNLAIKHSPKMNCTLFNGWDIDITITVNNRLCNTVSLSTLLSDFFFYLKSQNINVVCKIL